MGLGVGRKRRIRQIAKEVARHRASPQDCPIILKYRVDKWRDSTAFCQHNERA